jgi:hypothetical protein
MAAQKKVIVVPYYDGDGNINYIDLTAGPFDQAFFDARVNESDRTKRWFPLPELKNVVDERAEDIFEEFEDGTRAFVQQGARSFSGMMIGQSPQILGKIKSARCVEVGIFVVDNDGNLIGSLLAPDQLAPIRLDKESFSARLMKTTDTTVQKIMVNWNFHINEMDENLRMIASNELDYDVKQLRGLLDIYAEYSSISTTDFTVALYTDYGTPLNPVVDEGLVLANFSLFNTTTSLAVAITSVVESPDGTYDINFAAQTSGDVLRLTPSKAGRDYTEVIASLITIP